MGGSINGITVVGDVAYVGMGPRVAAIDISQHNKPQLMRQSEPLPGIVTQLLQIPREPAPLLLANAGRYLVLMDTSNPDELKPIHQLELTGAISAMVWDARLSILYAGGSVYQAPDRYTGFISAVDLTLDNHLKLIMSIAMPEQPLSLALGKESLFAGAQGYEGGLYHIQVKISGELSTPRLVIASTPTRPFQPASMQVIGERLYVSYRTMEAYELTKPDQPVQTWAKSVSGIVVKGFSVAGDQIHIFGWAPTDPYTPVLDTITVSEPITGSPMGEIATITAMHNGDFLVAYHDLKIYDTANPQALQLVGSYQAPVTNVLGAAVNGKVVFVVDNGAGDGSSNAALQVLNLPDLKPLGQVMTEIPNSWHWGMGNLQGIALESDRIYLASEDSVWVYDVSRVEPSLLGKLEISGGGVDTITATKIAENRLLVISQEISASSVLTIYDLTDLQKPTKTGNSLTLERGEIVQMTWDETALYAILRPFYENSYIVVYIINFDNNILTLKESLQVPGYMSTIAVVNKKIALAGSDKLMIVSADEPEPLKLLGQTTLPEYGVGVAIIKDKALVAVGDEYGAAQLLTFDIQDPAKPKQFNTMDIAVSNLHMISMLVTKPYLVLGNGTGGVEVLDFGP